MSNKIEQYKKERMPIAYVDESGFAHSMPRTHGYSRMGKRCYGEVTPMSQTKNDSKRETFFY